MKGLERSINLEIEKNLNFLKNTNIFFIDKQVLEDQINKYNFIETYNIVKLYPSKIILELQKTDFLAQTIKNNEIFLIGSNSKFIHTQKFNNYEDLPIVFGKFSAKKFASFKKTLNQSDYNYNDIKEIFFFPSGRISIKIIYFPYTYATGVATIFWITCYDSGVAYTMTCPRVISILGVSYCTTSIRHCHRINLSFWNTRCG